MQVITPPDRQHRDTVQRVLGTQVIDEAKLNALVEVLGVDLYFVLSVLAGEVVRFPKLDMVRSYVRRTSVYDLVRARIDEGHPEDEAIRQAVEELGPGWNYSEVRKAYQSIDRILSGGRKR